MSAQPTNIVFAAQAEQTQRNLRDLINIKQLDQSQDELEESKDQPAE